MASKVKAPAATQPKAPAATQPKAPAAAQPKAPAVTQPKAPVETQPKDPAGVTKPKRPKREPFQMRVVETYAAAPPPKQRPIPP